MIFFRFAFPHIFEVQGITYPLTGRCGHCGLETKINGWSVDDLKRVAPGWYLDPKNREACPLTFLMHKPKNLYEEGELGD